MVTNKDGKVIKDKSIENSEMKLNHEILWNGSGMITNWDIIYARN